ncbi:MAG: (deoxy)nucleoside triphosphate pyrophosphohydrolase [Actinomycetales bacterium]|nr:(deoxy)nucleoside triphosphate pyrophosphohydrolase [Actinomycetales bacterium]
MARRQHPRGRLVTVVVAAAIERDGRYLAARRTRPEWAAGRWEFPGGKVEHGESDEQALVREIREELGVEIAVVRRVPGEWPLHDDLVLHLYVATLVEGEPQPLDHHDELRWVTLAQFDEIYWLESDREAVDTLAKADT